MQPLRDGTYDVFIVDVREDEENIAMTRFEVVITSGEHKGEVVRVRAERLTRDATSLMGLPATLVVSEGAPQLSFDD
jgi:hypothetical protein